MLTKPKRIFDSYEQLQQIALSCLYSSTAIRPTIFERRISKLMFTFRNDLQKILMTPRYKYTLGFIECTETASILLLNRQKSPWMGRWNGVGGKLEETESPLECIIRETEEETGLKISNYVDRGVLKWARDGADLGGVHLFTGVVSLEEFRAYETPKVIGHEGILDWKKLDWILHEENTGIVDNIKPLFKEIFNCDQNAVFQSEYTNQILTGFSRVR